MITISGTVHYTGTNVTECCMRFVLSFPARSRILSHLPVYLDSRRGVTRCLLTFHLGYSCSLPVLSSSSSSLLPTLTQLSHFVRFLFVDSSVVTHSTFRCLSSIAFFNYKPPPPPPAPPLRMCLCLTEFASHFAARFPSTSPPPLCAQSPYRSICFAGSFRSPTDSARVCPNHPLLRARGDPSVRLSLLHNLSRSHWAN